MMWCRIVNAKDLSTGVNSLSSWSMFSRVLICKPMCDVTCTLFILTCYSSGDAAIKRTATRILSVWEERNVFSSELRQTLHNLLGTVVLHVTTHDTVTWSDVYITEPPVDTNSDVVVSKKSKLDISPPGTPPKRPPPEVRS